MASNPQPSTKAAARTKRASLHHVGFAVTSITAAAEGFAQSLGAEWDGHIIHDTLEEARVIFWCRGGGGPPAMELVEPAGQDSPLRKFVARGRPAPHLL